MLVQMFEGGDHSDLVCYHPFYPLFHIKHGLVLPQTSLGLWKLQVPLWDYAPLTNCDVLNVLITVKLKQELTCCCSPPPKNRHCILSHWCLEANEFLRLRWCLRFAHVASSVNAHPHRPGAARSVIALLWNSHGTKGTGKILQFNQTFRHHEHGTSTDNRRDRRSAPTQTACRHGHETREGQGAAAAAVAQGPRGRCSGLKHNTDRHVVEASLGLA